MLISVFGRIEGPFDSRELWNRISGLGINLTDLGSFSLIYGDINPQNLAFLCGICVDYGKLELTVSRSEGG